MGVIKELRTTIKLRYDILANWIAANPKPEQGEVCIAVIPTSSTQQPDYTVGLYPTESGLTPYAIGLKVGDGINYFNNLPWIQAIAGDVYSWAKQSTPPSANNIGVTYNNDSSNVQIAISALEAALANLHASDITVTYNNDDNSDIQTAISGIEDSLGNIVASGVDPATLGNALAQLQEQLAGQVATVFDSNQSGITYKVDTITQNGLNITTTSSPLVVSDISDLIFNKGYDSVSNKAATMSDLSDLETSIIGRIGTAMHFRGISSTAITNNGTEYPTINNAEITILAAGDVVIYGTKEFVWTGTSWAFLGDESGGNNLAQIAYTGNVNNLLQTPGDYLILDCGSSTSVI